MALNIGASFSSHSGRSEHTWVHMSLGGKRDTRKVRARENYRKRGRDLGLHAAARVHKGQNEREWMEKGRRRAKERRRSYTHTRACPILFATASERAATTCCAVATANPARLTWRGQGHARHLCLFRLQRKRPPQHQRHPRVHSSHGVLNLFSAPVTVARRRIDHKGFTFFHRDRPPILIVSGNSDPPPCLVTQESRNRA